MDKNQKLKISCEIPFKSKSYTFAQRGTVYAKIKLICLRFLVCVHRVRIFKRLRSQGIDAKELIPPAYVACRAGTSNRVVVPARQAGNPFLGSLKGLQIRALYYTRHSSAPGGERRKCSAKPNALKLLPVTNCWKTVREGVFLQMVAY